MSLKVLLFGHTEGVVSLIEQLKQPSASNHAVTDETIVVDTVVYDDTPFIVFSIKDRSLVAEQATGSNALIFILNSEAHLYEQRQYLFDLLAEKRQFDGLPLIVAFERGKGITIKEVINFFELFKVKDRASMIKEVNLADRSNATEILKWVQAQADVRGSKLFNAQPKVVKMKSKYREEEQEESQKKYELMLKDKDFKALTVKEQEQVYIQREKERLKNENMDKQLANFNKNKKKMSPYDIKATPNPKIDVNLHFFLKDPHNEKEPQVNIKIQTDEFKPLPPPKPYVPKKTGINISTQIEVNQLFDFNKQVRPILNILVTKALQTASLEIEEEEESVKIKKYKSHYQERLQKRKEHKQSKIEHEEQLIRDKEKLLAVYRAKDKAKKDVKKRVVCYSIANQFLQGLYKDAALALFRRKAYVDQLQNQLQSTYLQELMQKTALSYNKILERDKCLEYVFEGDCVDPLLRTAGQSRKTYQELQAIRQLRDTNKRGRYLSIHMSYLHDAKNFTSFTKYISKAFGPNFDAFVKEKEEQFQEISNKITAGELPEDELTKTKTTESNLYGSTHMGYMIGVERTLCFAISSNRYRYGPRLAHNGLLLLDTEQQIIDSVMYDTVPTQLTTSKHPFLRFSKSLRDVHQVANMDQGIVINLAQVSEKVKSIILFTRITEVQSYKNAKLEDIKYSTYGIEFFEKNVPIHRCNIGEEIKWEEVKKVPQGSEEIIVPSQQIIVVAYLLKKKGNDQWALEDVGHVSRGLASANGEQRQMHLEEIVRYYQKIKQVFKEQDQEEEPVQPIEKKAPNSSRNRSKKTIEQVKKKPVVRLGSKILPEILLNLHADFGQCASCLGAAVNQWRQFVQTCENGWELHFKGHKLSSLEQLRKFRRVGDLQVVKVTKIEQPKKEEIDIEDKGEDNEQS